MRISAVALAVAIAASGCGGDNSDASGELIQYRIEAGELDFPSDERTDSIIPIPDSLLVIQRDGRATYEFADQPAIDFRLSDGELAKLETDVDEIDFEEADAELSGETEEGLPALSVTHDGTTVLLGDEFIAINYGEGPDVADQMSDLLDRLDRVVTHAPGVERTSDKYLRSLKND